MRLFCQLYSIGLLIFGALVMTVTAPYKSSLIINASQSSSL